MINEPNFTHLDEKGQARMVDVTNRDVSLRTATTSGWVKLSKSVVALLREGGVPKGDVLATARVAAIMGAKRTPDLIPLCHPIALHGVDVELEINDEGVLITVSVKTADRTGVEMEALTAVAVAGLTVIDMVKALDPSAAICDVRVETKSGGRNGEWVRD
ncbi:MAG: cyclic pyranopterin monophosphate synthase MoaC [Actinobacteria bacterium]|uniref:cyclic pyranopterin monophosphate synthase n=1 Tax=freshwater metagenome TaxID=449393 RepID=A0A6J6N5Z4_9ZZZZ|nr:cyclic pyranopterin monophosphate synthase MoaC [Actinomycetota bacterium]